MNEPGKRLIGAALYEFFASLGIVRLDPVGRMPASGELATEAELTELLETGDPVPPGQGVTAEDPATLERLFAQQGEQACFPLTPDGHLANHTPVQFDASQATEQVITLIDTEMLAEDREEALTGTWLGLGYHNRDHPADFGGLLRGSDGRIRCCYLDVKRTQAATVSAQRTKLELRARERKLGLMAQTVTNAAGGGFEGYPGRGQPGLCISLLSNPVQETRQHAGFAINWFVGIASNFQAQDARWGWGGPRRVRLPIELVDVLKQKEILLGEEKTNWLALLEGFGSYTQYRNADGVWDRNRLQATLEAKSFAARYILMNENILEQANNSIAGLQPEGIATSLRLEDFQPGESLAYYYGKKCDHAIQQLDEATRQRDEAARQANEAARRLDEIARQADEIARQRDEATRQANEAARRLDEIARQRDEATRQANEATHQVEEIARQADEATRQRDEAARQANEAARRLDEIARQRDEATRQANEATHQVEEIARQADEITRQRDEATRQANEAARQRDAVTQREEQSVARRRQRRHADAEIAEDMGLSLAEFLQRFPPPAILVT